MKINFYLPGFSNKFGFNLLFARMLKQFPERFYDGVKIGAVYGDFPTSLWNGGRMEYGQTYEERFMRTVVREFNTLGIPIRYTFTNPLLEKHHLTDRYCNLQLEVANNGLNEVTVVSPILEEYIRKNYPQFKIISSTCKEIRNMDLLNQELEKDYKMVVLDYNWNNRFDELEKIKNKFKCEFLVNSSCLPNCPRRGEHYNQVGDAMIKWSDAKKTGKPFEPLPFECRQGNDNNFYTIQSHSTFVSPQSIYEKYVPMGFTNFKIEGRTGTLFGSVESYLNYLCKPEYRDETRLALLFTLQDNGIINVREGRK